MKKSTIVRTLFIAVLITASLGSFVFLNTIGASIISTDAAKQGNTEQRSVESKEKQLKELEVRLPDVMLLEQLIKIAKRLTPAS